jgi:Glycoside hydrolase family 44
MQSGSAVVFCTVVVCRHTSNILRLVFFLAFALTLLGLGHVSAQAIGTMKPDQAAPAVAVTTVAVTPEQVTLFPGDVQQFSAQVSGTGNFEKGVIWSVNEVDGGNASLGTISKSGLYVTPYPAPKTVRIKARSAADSAKSATSVITFAATPVAVGPVLAVDAGTPGHAISPLIYGMNAYRFSDPNNESAEVAKAVRLTLNRWGGDGDTRYNYKLDISNHGAHWFFENIPNSNTQYPDVSDFNTQVMGDRETGTKTMGTVPVMGWVAKSRDMAGSFSVKKYGPQQKTDPNWKDFGNGVRPDGTKIIDNDPNDTCMPVDASWSRDWVKYLVGRFGDAAHGGVAIYSLDNEPNWWDMNHRDVHPLPFTYDEVTENGLKVAKAVKEADPTAEVSGPVIDYWLNYFYSKADLKSVMQHGWSFATGAVDRKAHGNVPFVEYYLRTFRAAQEADPKHTRLLDYLDLHTYFAAGDAMLKPAGTSRQQQIVINSTRALWDPTYTSYEFRNPDNFLLTAAPAIIPRMKQWVAANYPGTKTAITEYNWGGAEHISGAVAEADILGIFGREGLDLGALWGAPDLNSPLMFAFKMFRNYDDEGGGFGDTSVASSSTDQRRVAVYAALRGADDALTIVVVNKTFGDLKSDVVLAHLKTEKHAKVYQYSGADLVKIRELPDAKVAHVSKKDKTEALKEQVFPAMSITLFVVRAK